MDACCEVPSGREEFGSGPCPSCGKPGKKVELKTVKALLAPAAMRRLDARLSYRFCASPDCAIVYFANQGSFQKPDLRVPVFQKDSGAQVPVCYCFGYTRGDLAAVDVVKSAQTSITGWVKQGICACEIRNPQGSCCLGNVAGFGRQLHADQVIKKS